MNFITGIVCFFTLSHAAVASAQCDLTDTNTLDRLFPQQAPWIQVGDGALPPGLAVPGVTTCLFATDPRASGDLFVDPQAPTVSVTKIVMRSAADAASRVSAAIERHGNDAASNPQVLRGIGDRAFGYRPASADGKATADVLFLTSHRAEILVEEWLHWPGEISPDNQGAAAALMKSVLHAAELHSDK